MIPKHVFAGSVTIDHREGQRHISIDGVRIPWWLEIPGPEVRKVDDIPMHVVTLPIYAEGVITIIGDDGSRETHDPVLGNVREWAARYVREEFAKAYPWLEVQ